MPVPHWNDSFGPGDYWTQKTFMDMFMKAIWERFRAIPGRGVAYPSGPAPTLADEAHQRLVKIYDPGPPEIIPDNAQAAGGDTNFIANQRHYDPLGVGIAAPTVRGLQMAIEDILGFFWDRNIAIEGQTSDSSIVLDRQPQGGYLTPGHLRSILGLSGNTNGGFSQGTVKWRRRSPREVWALDIQGVTRDMSNQLDSLGINDVPVGGRTRWIQTGFFGVITQNGVWQHQGGGVWTREPNPQIDPDTLDSENPVAGGSFMEPGWAEPGDISGPWLFENIRDALNSMVWIIPKAFTSWASTWNVEAYGPVWASGKWWGWYADTAGTRSYLRYQGISDNGHLTEAAAEAEALSRYANGWAGAGFAGDPTYPGMDIFIETLVSNVSGWNALVIGAKPYLGCGDVWQNRARAIDFYLTAGEGFPSLDPTLLNTPSPITDNTWTKVRTLARIAGTDTYAVEIDPTPIANYTPPPGWPPTPAAGNTNVRQMYIDPSGLFIVVKYDVPGGFQYTASTP